MGPWGAIIMSFFGAVFFAMAVVPTAGWRTPLLVVPCLAFALLTAAAVRVLRSGAAVVTPDARAERVITWATVGEGIAIPVLVTVLDNTGHHAWRLSGIALIVGLHFLPMAYAIPFAPFYALGAALVAAAAVGTMLPAPLGGIVAGLSASAALWTASAFAVRRVVPRREPDEDGVVPSLGSP